MTGPVPADGPVPECGRCGAVHVERTGLGARRCQKHTKRPPQAQCPQPALLGQPACRMHAGKSLVAAKAEGAANLRVAEMARAFGQGEFVAASHHEVLLWGVTVTWWRARWYARLLHDHLDGLPDPTTGMDHPLVRLEAEERQAAIRASKAAHDAGVAERDVRLRESMADELVGLLQAFAVELAAALGVVVGPGDPRVRAVVARALSAGEPALGKGAG